MALDIQYDAEEHKTRARIAEPSDADLASFPGWRVYRNQDKDFDLDLQKGFAVQWPNISQPVLVNQDSIHENVITYHLQPGKDGRSRPAGWKGNKSADPKGTLKGFRYVKAVLQSRPEFPQNFYPKISNASGAKGAADNEEAGQVDHSSSSSSYLPPGYKAAHTVAMGKVLHDPEVTTVSPRLRLS